MNHPHARGAKSPVPPEIALANDVFDQFCSAAAMKTILGHYRHLCELLSIKPTNFPHFYPKLKSKLKSWKAQALWNKFDKRASHKCYNRGKACSNNRVLIIGAGPCGLRAAIEAQLLGAKVVVLEKRDRFSRNNVLHLWPFVIHDLKSLGAKKFFGKFCAGSIDHISIRQLQCILMKVALILGVEIHEGVGFESLLPPPSNQDEEKIGWRAVVSPPDHPVSQYEFNVLVGADGKRNTLEGFKRKEFRGKLAIAITANFINKKTEAEARVEEISGVAFIFNQKFFKDLYAETGIDLENIVYYKDDTHYFVMTAKKQSLLDKGVILNDFADTARLLSQDNIDKEALKEYARQAADFSTDYNLPHLEFAVNHYGQSDVAMFDFTSMYAAENACRFLERNGHKLLMTLVGDSLLEPFWPTGSGCARGFLSSMDACWAIRSWAAGILNPIEVLAERESIYRILGQTTPENLHRDHASYSLDPTTRYPNLNQRTVLPVQVKGLYDTDDPSTLELYLKAPSTLLAPGADQPKKRRRRDLLHSPRRGLRQSESSIRAITSPPLSLSCSLDSLHVCSSPPPHSNRPSLSPNFVPSPIPLHRHQCKFPSNQYKFPSNRYKYPSSQCKSPSNQCKAPFNRCKSPFNRCKFPFPQCKYPSNQSKSPSNQYKSPSNQCKFPSNQCKFPSNQCDPSSFSPSLNVPVSFSSHLNRAAPPSPQKDLSSKRFGPSLSPCFDSSPLSPHLEEPSVSHDASTPLAFDDHSPSPPGNDSPSPLSLYQRPPLCPYHESKPSPPYGPSSSPIYLLDYDSPPLGDESSPLFNESSPSPHSSRLVRAMNTTKKSSFERILHQFKNRSSGLETTRASRIRNILSRRSCRVEVKSLALNFQHEPTTGRGKNRERACGNTAHVRNKGKEREFARKNRRSGNKSVRKTGKERETVRKSGSTNKFVRKGKRYTNKSVRNSGSPMKAVRSSDNESPDRIYVRNSRDRSNSQDSTENRRGSSSMLSNTCDDNNNPACVDTNTGCNRWRNDNLDLDTECNRSTSPLDKSADQDLEDFDQSEPSLDDSQVMKSRCKQLSVVKPQYKKLHVNKSYCKQFPRSQYRSYVTKSKRKALSPQRVQSYATPSQYFTSQSTQDKSSNALSDLSTTAVSSDLSFHRRFRNCSSFQVSSTSQEFYSLSSEGNISQELCSLSIQAGKMSQEFSPTSQAGNSSQELCSLKSLIKKFESLSAGGGRGSVGNVLLHSDNPGSFPETYKDIEGSADSEMSDTSDEVEVEKVIKCRKSHKFMNLALFLNPNTGVPNREGKTPERAAFYV